MAETMRPLPFVIVGTAKGGLEYIYSVLASAGVNATCFKVFSNHGEEYAEQNRLQHSESNCEISWMAAPFLQSSPILANTCVVRLMRDPFATVRSLAGGQLFRDDDRLAERPCASLFIEKHCPRVFQQPDELSRAADYVLSWDALMMRQYACRSVLFHRVEDDPSRLLQRMRSVQDSSKWKRLFPAIAIGDCQVARHPVFEIDPILAVSDSLREGLSVLARNWGYLP